MERELILDINMKSTESQQVITYGTRCVARTTCVPDFVDVTDDLAQAVASSEVRRGRAIVFAADETCTIMVNEKETGLLTDIGKAMKRIGATNGARAVVGASSVTLPIDDGKLQLGTWQRVLLVELGTAGDRTLDVEITGER